MKNTGHRLKSHNLHSPDYLLEAAMDQEWEEAYRNKYIPRPTGNAHANSPVWQSEGITASSDEAGCR